MIQNDQNNSHEVTMNGYQVVKIYEIRYEISGFQIWKTFLQVKEDEADLKFNFWKKLAKRKKDRLSGPSGHLKKKKYQILAKKTIANADQKKRTSLLSPL